MAAIWRGDVPTLELLNQMVTDELPLGLRAGVVQPFFQRDVYFDSPDRALHRRGVTCRFRARVDDTRILSLRIVSAAGGAPPVTFDAQVPELDAEAALAGASEPARRLRALIDPPRLRRRIEFETERRERHTHARWWGRARYEILYDVVTVRSGQRAEAFQELQIREAQSGRPTFDALTQAFKARYNVRPLLVSKLDRAEKVLRDLESAAVALMDRETSEVALVVLQDGDIALLRDPTGLTLPTTGGQGEASSRELLRSLFDSADGQIRFLGTAPASGSRPLLQTWLAHRAAAAARPSSGRVQWVPLAEALAMAGAPGLRDPRTLAALTVLTRLEDVTPLFREPARRTGERHRRLSDLTPGASSTDSARPAADQVLNADLSVLEFNSRVLALAEDARVPLLARVRFLSILSANLDEFFMVRVSALKHAIGAGASDLSEDGLTAGEQLDAIKLRVRAMLGRQSRCLTGSCLPALAAHQVRLLRWSELSPAQQEALRRYFQDDIAPIITPQAITRAPGHPFPLVPNLRLSLAVVVRDPRGGATQFAYLKVPDGIPRLVPVPQPAEGVSAFVPIEEIIRENVGALYPGLRVEGTYAFRVTRAADLELDERHAVNLLQVIGEETTRRPWGAPVRLEVEQTMPESVRELLLRELQFEDVAAAPGGPLTFGDIYEAAELVDLTALRELAQLPLQGLDYPPHRGASPIPTDRSIFAAIAEADILVHHPYDAFDTTVERLFVEAADDADVVAIKLTLYRAGGRSRIVEALLRAAQSGKEVFVFVELKARFDEERNIEWTKKLEQGGVRVVYGLVDFKTHAKTALVVRREPGGLRRYVHIGTGNYNAATAALYTDVGLLTADPTLGADVHDFFNELSGSSQPPRTPFRALLVSPLGLLPRLLELIEREAAHARAGRGGSIRAKLNGLADPDLVAALYRASQAGVDIELVIRGICTLRPGVVGLSERIRVVSILGRFLEHARIYRFRNAGEPEYFIGSADWRPRNLRRRVEVVAPVLNSAARKRLDALLDKELSDPDGWELLADGSYARPESAVPKASGQR
jgi:polyphosphate kinase